MGLAMGGRSKLKERMHEPVKVWELKKLDDGLDCSQICGLLELEIKNMDKLFFKTNKGLNRNESPEIKAGVVNSLCGAFGYSPSEQNLLKIREFAGPYLTKDFIEKKFPDTSYLLDVRNSIFEIRKDNGLSNPCEQWYSD
jgi:hypothetical protein